MWHHCPSWGLLLPWVWAGVMKPPSPLPSPISFPPPPLPSPHLPSSPPPSPLPLAQTANEESCEGDGETAEVGKEEREERGGAEEEGRREAEEKGPEEFYEVSCSSYTHEHTRAHTHTHTHAHTHTQIHILNFPVPQAKRRPEGQSAFSKEELLWLRAGWSHRREQPSPPLCGPLCWVGWQGGVGRWRDLPTLREAGRRGRTALQVWSRCVWACMCMYGVSMCSWHV